MLGGLLIMVILAIAGSMSKKFEHRTKLDKVDHLILQSDFSDIQLVGNKSEFSIELHGKKSLFSKPLVQVSYEGDKAYININILNKGWKKYLPGRKNKAKLVVNIPSRMLDSIELKNQNGNIDIGNMSEMSRLSIHSLVGNIGLSSFQGELLSIKSNNGSLSIGKVNAQVNIDNKVGGIKSLELLSVQGANHISISNGNVHLQLPKGVYTSDIGLDFITKNGTITSNESGLSYNKKGPGMELVREGLNANSTLNISVSVGNIKME